MSNSLVNPIIYGAFHVWTVNKRNRSSRRSISRREHTTQHTATVFFRENSNKSIPLQNINNTSGNIS